LRDEFNFSDISERRSYPFPGECAGSGKGRV
jgi:hypothetical protein